MPENVLNLVDRGHGDPAIIFIHGFTCNLSNWNEQLSALSGAHRCVAVDLPGHGASAEPREATIEALAAAVNNTLDALELNHVVLVGHSMGCRIATEVFNQSPGRVRGIVHIDGSAVAAGNADAEVKRYLETIDRIGMDVFLKQLYDDFFVETTPAAIQDSVNAGLRTINTDFARRLWLNLVRWDASRARELLAAIDVPLLLIQTTFLDAKLKRASLSPGQTTPWTDEVAKAVKDVTMTVVPGVGHFPMQEAPQQTNDAISNFVRRLT